MGVSLTWGYVGVMNIFDSRCCGYLEILNIFRTRNDGYPGALGTVLHIFRKRGVPQRTYPTSSTFSFVDISISPETQLSIYKSTRHANSRTVCIECVWIGHIDAHSSSTRHYRVAQPGGETAAKRSMLK